ncbi:uncharacterized protein FPRO_13669 [Fusarium proliferatum ET1]|uniref:MADS-box domain-containing protein n=1 Tax=Fusarium proliferatum (strain ET1) TaxID=1227346 RepID=A0A1L7VTY0_FUSPR|nr:uncharacterized protein FPRO_13669 [Fusarium proliferatum ET1]CZR43862.1 uncharacterized protein FPRO_13669 [Fusarium proliferatum ET1]
MASKPETIVTKRDRTKENFSRAVWRLMKRCDQMHSRYGTDVYVLFKRKYQHYEYNSSQSTSFPTPLAELEITYPVPTRRTPANFDNSRLSESRE